MSTALPCAVYTRKSSEEGLEQGFNSLDAQREACEAFILSQKTQGWLLAGAAYEDGGYSGGNTDRPGLKRLLAAVSAGRVKIVVVYKVDRLTRSLADFAKLVELFDAHGVSFVSVTQQFNTTTSMGRLTLNVLLSFAQFEREVTGERIRDKIAASKRKGLWMGGVPPMGYRPQDRTLVIDEPQAQRVREMFGLYLALGSVPLLKAELDRLGWVTAPRRTRRADAVGGRPFSRGHLYKILGNPIYAGRIVHKGKEFPGQHPAIVDGAVWQAVQEQLAANLSGQRTRARAAHPSLLTGLVFDEQGHRLVPTHAKKGERRYRYYIGERLLTQGREAAALELRVPAHELELAVLGALGQFLADEHRLMAVMGEVSARLAKARLERAAQWAQQLAQPAAAQKIPLLQRVVRRIEVHADRLEMVLDLAALWETHAGGGHRAVEARVVTPARLKRCGMAMRLVLAASGTGVDRQPDPKLLALVAKAHDWFERLSSGRCDSVMAIAQQEQVTGSYVGRVIQLAFLAPDIVQRLQRGEHPLELNAHRLLGSLPLPLDWPAQRALLGMQG